MIEKKRLLTRGDFDGLVCATLLKEVGIVDEIAFVHPKDMQEKRVSVSEDDITANLPYVEGVYLAFDHHASELTRVGSHPNYIVYPNSPSAARVIYEYYGGAERFKNISPELMQAVDTADSGKFTKEDVLNPQGWIMLGFIMDARTGLGRFRNFKINNRSLLRKLVDLFATSTIDQILEDPDVRERIDLYHEQHEKFVDQLKRCTRVNKNAALIDLRDEEVIFAGNRFLVYALFPEVSISAHEIWGKNKRNVVFAVGKSIFNRTSKMNIGEFLLQFGGGGHAAAGTCQVSVEQADDVCEKIITAMTQDV